MTRTQFIGSLLVSFSLVGLPATAEHHETADSLEDVVAKHIEAKGGREAWNAIESLRVTGESTAFSKVNPFTLHKTQDRRLHIDYAWGDQPVVIGYDSKDAWWDNGFFGKGPRFLEGADRAVLERDLDFATPLFDLDQAGHKATLLGIKPLEGQPLIAVELERADESKETWYLDPTTYLEVARSSPASDFGRPMVQTTFYDDFRTVAGVKIPHFSETQWYTRHRVLAADSIEANVEIDDSLFSMPAPLGMEQLQALAGSWDVTIESRQSPAAPFATRESTSQIDGHFRGGMFQESWTEQDGNQAIRNISYDQFRERYVVTQIAGSTNTMDILVGNWNEDGALVLDDKVTETPTLMFGMTIYERMRLFDFGPDSFKMERESSIDGGENWAVMQKLSYARTGTTASADSTDASDAGAEGSTQ